MTSVLMISCAAFIALVYTAPVVADTKYLGLYMNGQKIGYATFQTESVRLHGKSVTKSYSTMRVGVGMQGAMMKFEETTLCWADSNGRPIRSLSSSTSSGRLEKTEALYSPKSVVFHIDRSGLKTTRTVPIPTGAPLVEDALSTVMNKGLKQGSSKTMFVVDESTNSFDKTTVSVKGPSTTTVKGKQVKANLVEIVESGVITKVYLAKNGDVVRVLAPAGMEMLPVSRGVALGKDSKYNPALDLSEATSIKSDDPLDDAGSITRLKLVIHGDNLPQFRSDGFETVTKAAGGYSFDIHPPIAANDPPKTIDEVAAQKPEWIKPSLDMPSDSPRFKSTAKGIIGSTKDVQNAAFGIQSYVYQVMKPNAGIGVLRDATEVLDSKEGVCRDYALLTVTLLRAARIPARLASGLVSWDGTFYYHMWAEAWDGTNWIGVDSTTDKFQLSATHIKFGEGNVDTAYSFSFLDKAKISIVESRKD